MILYTKQHAWLSAPVETKKGEDPSRPRMKERGEDRFPPRSSLHYLLDWLFEFGPMSSNGFGNVGVSFSEILAWSTLVDRRLTPRESRILYDLSSIYSVMFSKAAKPECTPPYQPDVDEHRKDVSEGLRAMFDMMIARQKK